MPTDNVGLCRGCGKMAALDAKYCQMCHSKAMHNDMKPGAYFSKFKGKRFSIKEDDAP